MRTGLVGSQGPEVRAGILTATLPTAGQSWYLRDAGAGLEALTEWGGTWGGGWAPLLGHPSPACDLGPPFPLDPQTGCTALNKLLPLSRLWFLTCFQERPQSPNMSTREEQKRPDAKYYNSSPAISTRTIFRAIYLTAACR